MSRRPPESRIREQFAYFVNAMGGTVAKHPKDMGSWLLKTVYDGYTIHYIADKEGHTIEPFGSSTRSPEEIGNMLMFGAKVASMVKAS